MREIKVLMHHTPHVNRHKLDKDDAHFGGDLMLANNFVHVMRGTESSICTLEDGLLSTLLCLKARESAQTNTFQRIFY
jgi:hypothetical protein